MLDRRLTLKYDQDTCTCLFQPTLKSLFFSKNISIIFVLSTIAFVWFSIIFIYFPVIFVIGITNVKCLTMVKTFKSTIYYLSIFFSVVPNKNN